MNHRETTSVPSGAVPALLCWALLLMPTTGFARGCPQLPACAADMPVQEHPYLASIGAPPLRFAEALPPAEAIKRPVFTPAVSTVTTDVAPPEATTNASTPTPDTAVTNHQPGPIDGNKPVENVATEPAPTRTPPPIIPDELHPRVHPEDFLPFFQIPVSKPGDVNVVIPGARSAPAPASIPVSSATYTQTPR